MDWIARHSWCSPEISNPANKVFTWCHQHEKLVSCQFNNIFMQLEAMLFQKQYQKHLWYCNRTLKLVWVSTLIYLLLQHHMYLFIRNGILLLHTCMRPISWIGKLQAIHITFIGTLDWPIHKVQVSERYWEGDAHIFIWCYWKYHHLRSTLQINIHKSA